MSVPENISNYLKKLVKVMDCPEVHTVEIHSDWSDYFDKTVTKLTVNHALQMHITMKGDAVVVIVLGVRFYTYTFPPCQINQQLPPIVLRHLENPHGL